MECQSLVKNVSCLTVLAMSQSILSHWLLTGSWESTLTQKGAMGVINHAGHIRKLSGTFPENADVTAFCHQGRTERKICVSRVWLSLFWKWEALWVSVGRMRENSNNNKKQTKEGLECWKLGTAEAEEMTLCCRRCPWKWKLWWTPIGSGQRTIWVWLSFRWTY